MTVWMSPTKNVHHILCKLSSRRWNIMRMRKIKLGVKYPQLLSSELEGVSEKCNEVH